MANGDVFRVTLKHAYTDAGVAVQHVLWFQQTSDDPVAGEADVMAVAVGNAWTSSSNGEPRAFWSPAFQFLGTEAQKMLDPFEPPVSYAVPGVLVGTGDDHDVGIPTVCSMVMTVLSTRGGRRGRGRVYLGGFAARRPNIPGVLADYFTLTAHGHWSVLLGAAVQNWFNTLADTFDGVTVVDGPSGMKAVWGVWSRAIGGNTPPYNPAGFAAHIGHSTDRVVRVQRRREYGHGI